MSALDTSNEFRRSGSFLDRAKERLHDAVETVKQVGNDIKTDVIKPLEEAGKNIKESADIMKEGASALKDMASQLTPDASLETIGKAAEKFDGDWDKFAADFDKKYRTIKEAGEDNVLETMVRQTFGNKVFEAGSIIKNEAPNLLNGISGIQNGVSTISAGQGDLLTRAKEIKDSTAKIIESVKQVDASLNNVFTRVTNQLAVDATALIGLQKKLHDVVGKANTCIPDGLKSSASRLGDGIDALDAGRTMITAMIADCQGQVSAQGLANLANHFDKNWDNFAQKANDLYAHLSGDDKVNILETIAKSQFGDNVFYAGSAIKNEMPNVLSGISDFQNSVNIFKGDYSTPQAAVNTIKNGVEGIVRATEKIAKSINNAIKIYKGRGNTQNVTGLPLLDNMSKIGDAAVVKALGNSLALGADGLSAANNFSALQADLKSGNLSKAWKDLQALIKDTGKVAKDINNLIKGKRPKGFDDGQSASSQKDSEKEEKKEEEKDDKAAKLSLGSDSYVCSGATLRCPFGDRTSKLSVYPDRMVYLTGQPMANVSDHISMYNIHPFGKCRTTSYPPTGSATAANHGALTPMPCVPGTMSNWMQGKTDYIVKGHHALLKSSYCKCQWGGIITITDDGQRDTGKPDMSRERRETPEEMKAKMYIGIDVTEEDLLKSGFCESSEDVKDFLQNIKSAREHFAKQFYREHGMQDEKQIESHVNGIDLSKPVRIKKIPPPSSLTRFEDPENLHLGSYFGIPQKGKIFVPRDYGILPVVDDNGNVRRKKKYTYEFTEDVVPFSCLESTAKALPAPLDNDWESNVNKISSIKNIRSGEFRKNWMDTKGGAIQVYISEEYKKYIRQKH